MLVVNRVRAIYICQPDRKKEIVVGEGKRNNQSTVE